VPQHASSPRPGGPLTVMIEQAGVRHGMRVLAIGSAAAIAAPLAAATGPAGHVVIMDADPAETARAIAALRAASPGCPATVITGDGEHGAAEHAPFDVIIASGGAWDIPPAWTAQLAEGGTLVVPCQTAGVTRSVAFRKAGGHLASVRAAAGIGSEGTGSEASLE
jgi:protein-L-isoaspartate(D-aspartate) O-methyltransferase